jgi:hypothetical protein
VDIQHFGKLSGKKATNSTKMQQIVEWHRGKVMKLLKKGESNQSEVARILQVDKFIICRDEASQRSS